MTTIELLDRFSKASEAVRYIMRAESDKETSKLFDILEEAEARIYNRINGCMLQDLKSMSETIKKLKAA